MKNMQFGYMRHQHDHFASLYRNSQPGGWPPRPNVQNSNLSSCQDVFRICWISHILVLRSVAIPFLMLWLHFRCRFFNENRESSRRSLTAASLCLEWLACIFTASTSACRRVLCSTAKLYSAFFRTILFWLFLLRDCITTPIFCGEFRETD